MATLNFGISMYCGRTQSRGWRGGGGGTVLEASASLHTEFLRSTPCPSNKELPKALFVSESYRVVITANIPVNRMAIRLKGKIGTYPAGRGS
jgi:hypothetical protein